MNSELTHEHDYMMSDDEDIFEDLYHLNSLSCQEYLLDMPRQNSLDMSCQTSLAQNKCYCGGDGCKQRYMRQSKYPRIIEPCSKLLKHGFDKKVQIRIPHQLQAHIGYGSCKHCYKALVTLVTHIQLQCGFRLRQDVIQTFCTPTEQDIAHARRVIQGFGLSVNFYIKTWAPSFQERFMTACGGTVHVQVAMCQFFAVIQPTTPQNDCAWIDSALVMLQPENNMESYIERIRAILEMTTTTSVHKLSMCNTVLYECLSKERMAD